MGTSRFYSDSQHTKGECKFALKRNGSSIFQLRSFRSCQSYAYQVEKLGAVIRNLHNDLMNFLIFIDGPEFHGNLQSAR